MAVARVRIPEKQTVVDGMIDSLAKAWNEQERDEGARAYFQLAFHRQLRARVLRSSLYRYPERDRQFLARQLLDLANALYDVVAPFV